MGYYENLKCGNCRYSFTGGYIPSNGFLRTYLGAPYAVCPECKTVNKTGFKPWSTYHTVEKFYHWASVLLRTFFFTFILSLVFSHFLLKWIFEESSYPLMIGLATPITVGVLSYYVLKELEEIKRVEEEYENITK
jgi:hypothetical protein